MIASISAASAFDLNDLSNVLSSSSGGKVSVSGIDFNIPNGFVEDENSSVVNESSDNPYVDFNMSSKAYYNGSGDQIIIAVSSDANASANDSYAETASLGGNKTTINGVDGYESKDPIFDDFIYVKDGKLVFISVTDKELIKDIVVA